MKFLIFCASLCLLVSLPGKSEKRQVSALDILNLPAENRKLAALEGDETLFEELRGLSRNPQQSMQVRWQSLMLMSEMNPRASIQELLKATASTEWFMRNAGLVALEQVQKTRAVEVAQELIRDKALVVRSAAVEVLSRSLSPAIREVFWQELYKQYNFRAERSLWVRAQILQALAQQPQENEGKIFERLLSEKDPNIQTVSMLALERLYGLKLGKAETPVVQKISLWQKHLRKNY
ncbi:MAG: HEAT repeat domain-containing protein [Bdellovibrionaceae bacterium]|nr:HEAT repeat domain-containing protein [Pseudobdellovibrionaceae bacterium]